LCCRSVVKYASMTNSPWSGVGNGVSIIKPLNDRAACRKNVRSHQRPYTANARLHEGNLVEMFRAVRKGDAHYVETPTNVCGWFS
jgi:hypothetical protein